jgi:hypothetical protein
MYDPLDSRPLTSFTTKTEAQGCTATTSYSRSAAELRDDAERHRVVHVEHPANQHSFGHAWAELLGGT